MNDDLLKLNMLTIAASGLLMLLTGVLLYLFRDAIRENLRYFLPIPPIGVAAYIFVFNFFQHFQGQLPEETSTTIREILTSAGITAVVFVVFVIVNISVTYLLKRLF
jgi:hypothetical protein